MHMKILGKRYTGATLADMVRQWNEARDRLDFGASQQAGANIIQNGRVVAFVSYNGRLWTRVDGESMPCEF